jgi:hypothetical protein
MNKAKFFRMPKTKRMSMTWNNDRELYCLRECQICFSNIILNNTTKKDSINHGKHKMTTTVSMLHLFLDVYPEATTPFISAVVPTTTGDDNNANDVSDINPNKPIGDVDHEIVGLLSMTNDQCCLVHTVCGETVGIRNVLFLPLCICFMIIWNKLSICAH